jgi:NAD(P)-dependent dehydrogenase (short-subunit alcohol dehydrogenase family)
MTSKPIILVTGGSQGLGHETLKVLAQKKAYHLVVAARSQEKADEAVRVIAAASGGNVTEDFTPVVIDVTSDETIQAAATLVKQKFGRLDILVNNAGIARSPRGDNVTLRQDLRDVFETNVFGVAVMNETFLPLLRASTFPQRRIVTVTSGLGMFGVALKESSPYNAWNYRFPVYRSSKSAVNMISAVDMIALRDENISTVLVEPGYCRTAFGNYHGHKDADAGGRVIARAAVEGDNKDLFLKIVDDEGKHEEFGW